MKLNKKEKMNEQIAKYFGFKKDTKVWGVKGYRETNMYQWTFPDDDWYLGQGGVPNFSIPDFITLLEDYLKMLKDNSAFGKRERFRVFEREVG